MIIVVFLNAGKALPGFCAVVLEVWRRVGLLWITP
jgi:hypothetical protein